MNIVEFPCRDVSGSPDWRADELRQLTALFGTDQTQAGITWEVGATEAGDPQFYLLGPAPDHECLLCISRLAHGYVLEDGAGRLLGEAPALHHFAEQAARAALRSGRSFVARMMLALCAIRLAIEEKLEPIFEESQELLVRFAPQVAAFV
jgi:hypothetical protein